MLEAAVLRDAVIEMHHVVARPQLLEVEQRGALRARFGLAMRARLAEDFLLAVDIEAVGFEHHAGGNLALDNRRAEILRVRATPEKICSPR